MVSLARSASVLAVLALALAGCGGSDDDKPTDETSSSDVAEIDADPADGDTIKADDFSYSVPEGWEDASDLDIAKGLPASAVSLSMDLTDTDGFVDNINILRIDPAPVTDLGKLEDASVRELETADTTDVKVGDRVAVDGSPAIHITAGMTQMGASYLVEQFNVIRDDVSYVVTFSFSTDVTQADRDEVSQSVLASWQWAA